MDVADNIFSVSTNDSNSSSETAAPNGFTEGQTLAGCYALIRRLDAGKGPEIWLANDDVLGKDVTLHLLPAAVAKDGKALQDLRQEIKRARQLIHPQILRVYDLIEEPEWAAVSMNAFEGESLAVLQEKQPGKQFTAGAIESWFYQLTQTIDDAHKIQFLHRDLVPQNIFLTAAGQVLVANFGISRTIQDALGRAGQADESRRAFASPQVLDGQAPARTDDVYSLGATLYMLLAGAPPAAGGDVAGLDKPDVPASWRETIAASLQKSSEARPQTAGEFLKRLKDSGAAPGIATPVMPASVPSVPGEAPKASPVEAPVAKAEGVASVEKTSPSAESEREKVTPEAESKSAPGAEVIPSKALETTPSKAPGSQPAFVPEPKPEPSAPYPPRTEPARPLDRPSVGEFKPRLYPEESRFPIVAVGIVALLLLAAVIWHFSTSSKKTAGDETALVTPVPATPGPTPEKQELRPVISTPVPPKVVTETTPAPQTPSPLPKATPVPEEEKALVDKQNALEKAKEVAQAAEKAHVELLKQQQEADAFVAESQKAVDEKTKTYTPLKKAADEAAAQRKKLEDDQKAAMAAAEEAQKVAAEKARLVEENKKKLEEMEKQSAEKQAAREQADAELQAVQKAFADKQKAAMDAAKAAAEADAARHQQQAAIVKRQKEVEDAKAAIDLQKGLKEKVDRLKKFAANGAPRVSATPAPLGSPAPSTPKPATPEPVNLAKNITPAPMTPKPLAATPAPATPAPATPAPATPSPATPAPATPVPTTPPPTTPVPATPKPATPIPSTPPPATPAPATPAPAPATPAVSPVVATNGAANSLGMKFAAVGDVEFSIWLTRVKDFEVFAKDVNLKSTSWRSPGFRQASDHPVVNVTWQEAVAFCQWLTNKEHESKVLATNEFYRLPTDLEWSKAVGLPEENGRTPEARDMGIPDVYPWGTQWPPPPGAGNYTGEETGSDVAIKGYEDGFAWTSPVGSFKPNKYGLYDMGGNVWQWCMDTWNNDSKAKVLRGASWYNGALKLSLLSSCRVHASPDSSTDNYGFRIVRATEGPGGLKNKFR